jgi:uncharacterized protein (TIGR02391 family)
MSEILTYYQRYCEKGHSTIGLEQIVKSHCTICGTHFVEGCSRCNHRLQPSFVSRHYFGSSKPVWEPLRPEHCPDCGAAFPWTEPHREQVSPLDLWSHLHPSITGVARKRFESGHYADAVEAALKHINAAVKAFMRKTTGKELDGSSLMHTAFSPKQPFIVLADLSTISGQSIQQGYMELFAGAMSGVRNPKAHDNIEIDEPRAIHFLFLASLLNYKLDERI